MPAGSSSASRSGRPFWRPHSSPPTGGSSQSAVAGASPSQRPTSSRRRSTSWPTASPAGTRGPRMCWGRSRCWPERSGSRSPGCGSCLLVGAGGQGSRFLGRGRDRRRAGDGRRAWLPDRATPSRADRTPCGAARRARAVRIDGSDDGDVRRGGIHPGVDLPAGRDRRLIRAAGRAHPLGDRLRRTARRARRALPARALRTFMGKALLGVDADYLTALRPGDVETERLPERMTGAEFLRLRDGVEDEMSAIESTVEYRVRAATLHPIEEQARVETFLQVLEEPITRRRARVLGDLMAASHAGYSRCGLRSTDDRPHRRRGASRRLGARSRGRAGERRRQRRHRRRPRARGGGAGRPPTREEARWGTRRPARRQARPPSGRAWSSRRRELRSRVRAAPRPLPDRPTGP